MSSKPEKEDRPNPNSPVCQLLQSKLGCHMAEFNPHELKRLEGSGKLQEYLEERSSQARLIYLLCRKAALSAQEAGKVADQDLYPKPETNEEEDNPE
jgi:hypothetical protein